MSDYNDDPLPYHGVAEMLARSKATMLTPSEVRQVSDEHPGERAWRDTENDGHDLKDVDALRSFLNEEPVWREVYAEIDRRDPAIRHVESLDGTELYARRFAEERHGAQRYGEHVYVVHLWAVRQVLTDFGYHGGPLAKAAWLHDLIEDTATTREEIAERFGEDVAALVWAVTCIGGNRKERNASAYEKIRQCPQAAILKLADRIANVEASQAHPDKLAMYRKERAAFEDALGGMGNASMWGRLSRALDAPCQSEIERNNRMFDAVLLVGIQDPQSMCDETCGYCRPERDSGDDMPGFGAGKAALAKTEVRDFLRNMRGGFNLDDDEPSAGDEADAMERAR